MLKKAPVHVACQPSQTHEKAACGFSGPAGFRNQLPRLQRNRYLLDTKTL